MSDVPGTREGRGAKPPDFEGVGNPKHGPKLSQTDLPKVQTLGRKRAFLIPPAGCITSSPNGPSETRPSLVESPLLTPFERLLVGGLAQHFSCADGRAAVRPGGPRRCIAARIARIASRRGEGTYKPVFPKANPCQQPP